MKIKRHSTSVQGFTVIELLVATAVFGVVLLVVTVAILQFTRVYYRGVTGSNTQEIARTVVDQISQAIQFNGGPVTQTVASPAPGGSYAFCVGNQQYSYAVGAQLADSPAPGQTRHALVVREAAGCTSSTPAQNMQGAAIVGRELLAPNMRLSRLQITNIGPGLYKISIRVVFGDDDLLNNPTSSNAACKNQPGSTQFCAASDITTIVTKRVE